MNLEKLVDTKLFTEIIDTTLIAEECIEAYQLQYPDKTVQLWHNFRNLKPSALFGNYSNEIGYRHHCNELLERIVSGNNDLAYPTSYEILCSIVLMSTTNVVSVTPSLSETFGYLMAKNCVEVFPSVVEDDIDFMDLARKGTAIEVEKIYHIEQFLEVGLKGKLAWRQLVEPKKISKDKYSIKFKDHTRIYEWERGNLHPFCSYVEEY